MVLRAAGVDLDIVAAVGPVIADPVRTEADVAVLKGLEPTGIDAVSDAVGLLVGELGDVPLIGFAGGTVHAGVIVPRGRRPQQAHERTKAMMMSSRPRGTRSWMSLSISRSRS